ncbi:hypothetical protein N7509_012603 [Penicillium cosmopolitanum]|uniref:Uncharacterized protein n=1 Tax=Penicillium cosmopolitanum TaxID=1131564 RepID=A0A9W9SKN5_9EURO|nr:uncharacterized protein N7509_012603 [Penicillium cosmopolitanum]KAJ5379484.1 hypothetical protein N7509_012603 [Penicillium cosmopolitanum]
MNTIRSTWVGWGTLCVGRYLELGEARLEFKDPANSNFPPFTAGGGAYYFAKQSVNADRQARFEADMKRKAQLKAMENDHKRQAAMTAPAPDPTDDASLKRANMTRFQNAADDVASPSAEASHDPAPTRHEPMTENDRVLEKGKYEAAQPYRPPSGNRFS